MIDWLNDNSGAIQAVAAIVLALTLIAVGIYAWQTRRQAQATERMAEGMLRPVVTQWIKSVSTAAASERLLLLVRYENIGNGPAINLEWSLPGGRWSDNPIRVGLGVRESGEIKGSLSYPLRVDVPTVVVKYEDAGGVHWVSTLELVHEDGYLGNGKTRLERLG